MFIIPRRIIRVIFNISCVSFFTDVHQWSISLRANCKINEEVLCQSKDAALKFRGCFQAVCEPRSVPIEGGWLVRRVVWCAVDRAWSSLNLPIELRSDPPFPRSLSLSYPPFLSLRILPPSLFISSTFQIFRSFSLSCSSHRSHIFIFSAILFPSHPPFALCIGHGNKRLLHDVVLIGSLRQSRIWPTICMNYFLDESIPRRKWRSEQIRTSVLRLTHFVK